MIDYIKRKINKKKQKRTFREYGYELDHFQLDGIGKVAFAQWLHPFANPRNITKSDVDFYRRWARPGSMIIDIGAHTGDTSVPMALAVGGEGLVLALEPNRYVCEILKQNAQLNTQLTNIVPLCVAATAEDGEFTFNYSDASFCNGGFLSQIEKRRHGHNYTLKVEGKNLDRLLQERYSAELSRLDLLKIDAEGYDKEILKTIPNVLAQYRPHLLVECYKRLNRAERDELFDVISQHGYEIFRLDSFTPDGARTRLAKHNMSDERHFEILATHPSRTGPS